MIALNKNRHSLKMISFKIPNAPYSKRRQQCKTYKDINNYAEQKTYHNRAHFSNSIAHTINSHAVHRGSKLDAI